MSAAKLAVAAVLWTIAIALGVAGTVEPDQVLRFWGLMLALGAALMTCHLIVSQAIRTERIRVEHLVEGLIARARERADMDLTRLH